MIDTSKILRRLRRLFALHGVAGGSLIVVRRLTLKYLMPIARPLARRSLTRLVEAGNGPVILVRSTLDAAYPYSQRVHHLARELARQGHRVVFITPSTGYDCVLTASRDAGGMIVTPHGSEAIAAARQPTYLALSTDTTLSEADIDDVVSRGGIVVYDFIDHVDDAVSSHPLSPERLRLHQHLLSDTDNVLVLATADALLNEAALQRDENLILSTNGVDVDRFKGVPRKRTGLRGDFAQVVARDRPILGYYGSFASWFDYDLTRSLAQARPDREIVLIGPDLDGSAAALAGAPQNLHLLPAMRYEDLPRHAAWFDICLVPFVINDVTLATSPLKIFEYMALGRPTVSTDLPECRKYRSVLTASGMENFIAACEKALTLGRDPSFAEMARSESEENSWATKVQALNAALHAMPSRQRPEIISSPVAVSSAEHDEGLNAPQTPRPHPCPTPQGSVPAASNEAEFSEAFMPFPSDLKYDLTIPGQLTERECQAISSVARSLKPGAVIVEAGALYGRSTYCWSMNGPQDGKVVSIDPFERAEWIIEWVEKLQKVERPFSMEAFQYYTRDCKTVQAIKGYSPQDVQHWDEPIDLYFDDAVHEDPGFSSNVDFWIKFIKPGGYFCGHDFRDGYHDIIRRGLEIASEWNSTLHIVDSFFWVQRPE